MTDRTDESRSSCGGPLQISADENAAALRGLIVHAQEFRFLILGI